MSKSVGWSPLCSYRTSSRLTRDCCWEQNVTELIWRKESDFRKTFQQRSFLINLHHQPPIRPQTKCWRCKKFLKNLWGWVLETDGYLDIGGERETWTLPALLLSSSSDKDMLNMRTYGGMTLLGYPPHLASNCYTRGHVLVPGVDTWMHGVTRRWWCRATVSPGTRGAGAGHWSTACIKHSCRRMEAITLQWIITRLPSSLGPIVCSPVSGELATVDRGTTRYQVLIRSRSSLQRAQSPVCRWRYWHWTIGHRGRWGGVRWLHGTRASHWDHYGHGTGEGVSWPAGDCTHKSLDFFLRAAAASVE